MTRLPTSGNHHYLQTHGPCKTEISSSVTVYTRTRFDICILNLKNDDVLKVDLIGVMSYKFSIKHFHSQRG